MNFSNFDQRLPVLISERIASDGLFAWRNFLHGERLAAVQEQFDLVLKRYGTRYRRSARAFDIFNLGEPWVGILTATGLVPVIRAVLGPSASLSDYSLNCVHRGDARDDWHRDYPFNEMDGQDVSAGVLGLQCVLAVQKMNYDNGTTEYAQASFASKTSPVDGDGDRGRFEADAGDLLLMRAGLWHRAGLNTQPSPRPAVLLSFVEGWVRPSIEYKHVSDEFRRGEGSEDLLALLRIGRQDRIDGEEVPHLTSRVSSVRRSRSARPPLV